MSAKEFTFDNALGVRVRACIVTKTTWNWTIVASSEDLHRYIEL